jgi:chloramphenicol 3-O-phosphotransferase
MNCLRTAAELVKDSLLLPEQKASQAVSVAETLERHVLGQPCNCAAEGTEKAENKQAEREAGANGQ